MMNNLQLVEYAKSKLDVNTIYMLGGFGRVLTKAQIDARLAKGCSHTIRNRARIEEGIGDYCFDCVGLIKGALWETALGKVTYNKAQDDNVGMMYNKSLLKGKLEDMPDIPGLLVFTKNLGHVGIYIGKNENGVREYIESTPAFGAWGVTKTNDEMRNWEFWGQYYLADYPSEPVKTEPEVTDIKVGDWVRVVEPIIYNTNKKFIVFYRKYLVVEVVKDRVVIAKNNVVVAPVAMKHLAKV